MPLPLCVYARRRSAFRGLSIAVRTIVLVLCLTLPALAENDTRYGATLTAFEGAVTVWNTAAADWLPVAVNLPLAVDNRLRVARGASADILFDDGSVVTLEGETEVELRELTADTDKGSILASLYLKAGRLLANIAAFVHRESRFSVQTPTAVAGVRGTEFVVETSTADGTDVGVFEGRVAVDGVDPAGRADAGSRILLEKGYQTRVGRLKRPGAPLALKAGMRRHRGNLDRLAKRAKRNRRNLNSIRSQRIKARKQILKRWQKQYPKAFKTKSQGPKTGKPKPDRKRIQRKMKQQQKRGRPPK